jgi:hypothetical protein
MTGLMQGFPGVEAVVLQPKGAAINTIFLFRLCHVLVELGP